MKSAKKRKAKAEDIYLRTYSGTKFHMLNPVASEVSLTDIAHSLSLTCRYRGHCSGLYSVAQHCCEMVRLFNLWKRYNKVKPSDEVSYKLGLLFHDAAEAYLADIVSPLKPFLRGLKKLESNILYVIAEHFGFELSFFSCSFTKAVDAYMYNWEAEYLTEKPEDHWRAKRNPNPMLMSEQLSDIKLWSPTVAEGRYLKIAKELLTQNSGQPWE